MLKFHSCNYERAAECNNKFQHNRYIHTTKVFAYNCGKFNVSNACLKLSRLNAFGIANGLDMISELDLNESNTIHKNGNTTIAVIMIIATYIAIFFLFGTIPIHLFLL